MSIPSWVEYFLGFASHAARKSKDPMTQVGAVAVGQDREILETGYNGLPRGVADCPERLQRPEKYLWTGHAEENLVTSAARTRLKGSTVYVTHLCCNSCARMLINSGVAEVVCGNGKTSMPKELFDTARVMFQEANVKFIMEPQNEQQEV